MCRIVSIAILVTGGIVATLGAILLDDDLPFRLGLLLVLAGAICYLRCEVRANRSELERARQAGYDDGYDDGRTVARPVVVSVPWLRSSDDRPSLLSNAGAAEQLCEQGDVRRGMDRVARAWRLAGMR